MMRKYLILLVVFALVLGASMWAAARDRDKDRDKVTQRAPARGRPGVAPQSNVNLDEHAIVHDRLCRAGESGANFFTIVDQKQTGRVTRADLEDFTNTLMSADTSNKGYVTQEDMMAAANRSMRHKMMWQLRNKYDKNNDDRVSMAELGADAGAYGSLDVNRDGFVDSRDFQAIGQEACVATRDRYLSPPPSPAARTPDLFRPAMLDAAAVRIASGGGARSAGGGMTSGGAMSGGAAAGGAAAGGSTVGPSGVGPGTTGVSPGSTGVSPGSTGVGPTTPGSTTPGAAPLPPTEFPAGVNPPPPSTPSFDFPAGVSTPPPEQQAVPAPISPAQAIPRPTTPPIVSPGPLTVTPGQPTPEEAIENPNEAGGPEESNESPEQQAQERAVQRGQAGNIEEQGAGQMTEPETFPGDEGQFANPFPGQGMGNEQEQQGGQDEDTDTLMGF